LLLVQYRRFSLRRHAGQLVNWWGHCELVLFAAIAYDLGALLKQILHYTSPNANMSPLAWVGLCLVFWVALIVHLEFYVVRLRWNCERKYMGQWPKVSLVGVYVLLLMPYIIAFHVFPTPKG